MLAKNFVSEIKNDAPYSNIKYISMSFLTPNKIKGAENFNTYGFKIFDGYVNENDASNDVEIIKKSNKYNDIFVADVGKIYAWDDIDSAYSIRYDDPRMDELEKKRRENQDKSQMLMEQTYNEKIIPKKNNRNMNNYREILRKKYNSKQKTKNVPSQTTESIKQDVMDDNYKLIEEEYKNDHLSEYNGSGFKYGCMSVYIPETMDVPGKIKGLKKMIFKIRGIEETIDDINERVNRLKKISPRDNIYVFEIGKWIPLNFVNMNSERQLMELNYIMKKNIDNIEKENIEFEKRKEESINKNKTENMETIKDETEKISVKTERIIPDVVINPDDEENINDMLEYINN